MIKTEHGVVIVKGNIVELMADLGIIIYSLNKYITAKTDEKCAKKLLDMAYKEAFVEPKTEKKAETKELQELLNQLAKILSK
jgi:hypothetical protein